MAAAIEERDRLDSTREIAPLRPADDALVVDTTGRTIEAVVKELADSLAEACRAQGCVLTGGETSVQPGVVADGVYVLSASAIGVVERDRIIDGSGTEEDDVVLAVA